MVEDVLKEVKSPFTDELIQRLLEIYIACGCDNLKFYRTVNNLGVSSSVNSSHTRKFIERFCYGVEKKDDLSLEDFPLPYACEIKERWIIMFSERDPMLEETKDFCTLKPLIYRIYLNLKGKEKQNFILGYMKKCRENNVPYKFKFSRDDTRNDQIILLSRAENLAENISMVESLTAGVQLGEPPMLAGEYKNGIGVGEEYYNRLWGYTDVKLALLRVSVKKYLCDNVDEFSDELSDEERKELSRHREHFKIIWDLRIKEKEFDEAEGFEFEDLDKKPYQKKSSIDCASEHIENDGEAYSDVEGLAKLGGAIRRIYARNPKQFARAVIDNFRVIGTEVWGFSSDLVFSNQTEGQFGRAGAYKVMLTHKEDGHQLLNNKQRLVDGYCEI